jgi:hypothetical protein
VVCKFSSVCGVEGGHSCNAGTARPVGRNGLPVGVGLGRSVSSGGALADVDVRGGSFAHLPVSPVDEVATVSCGAGQID